MQTKPRVTRRETVSGAVVRPLGALFRHLRTPSQGDSQAPVKLEAAQNRRAWKVRKAMQTPERELPL
ncbi:MAG TPA: hypothetical protein VHV26_17730 [Rhizomicrobium sp.]|nr:hypothetical protein [Rhizomicrobium sp.]